MTTNNGSQTLPNSSGFLSYLSNDSASATGFDPNARCNSPQDITEDQLASEFLARHRFDLRYCHSRDKWFVWNGFKWSEDDTDAVFHGIRMLCREFRGIGKPTLGKAATVNGVAKLASRDPTVGRVIDDFDQDDLLLNTPEGIVDLTSGDLLPPDPEKEMSKSTSVAPAMSADCPRWHQFLDESTKGDLQLQRLLQQIAGYCLTGLTKAQVLFFIYGDGGNGKSVFLHTLSHVLGEYAATASMDLLTVKTGERHPVELAVLNGPRLVTVSETEEGKAWAEARLKALTGGDKIQARFMRQNPFEFTPRFKLLIVGNHKPNLSNVDEAMKRRFRLVPFINVPDFPDHELQSKLEAESSGILRWAINGCLDYLENGLIMPTSVTEATKAYFDAQDVFRLWLEECTEDIAYESERFSALYESWKTFALNQGEEPGSGKSFGAKLDRHGFYAQRETQYGKTVSMRMGLRLRERAVGYSESY